MKKIKLLILLGLVSVISSFGKQGPLSGNDIRGIWLGTMKVSEAMELRIAYVLTEKDGGGFSATMNVIEQKAFDIPMDTVIFTDGLLKIEFASAGISFSGKYNPSNKLIQGSYMQGDSSYSLNLIKVDKLPGKVVRTQIPRGPFPYSVEEVVFQNPADYVQLSGTLTIPEQGSKFPAIILVHGSGHTDRNETKMGHFHLLADFFSRNGFIVLRYDKRGVGSSTGNYDESTTFDFADDVKAGIEYLRKRKDVNSNDIGIIGHSEGSLIAPIVASEDKDLAFIILMGCMGVNGGEIRLQQTEMIGRLSGIPEEQIKADINKIKSYHEVIKRDAANESKFNTIKEMYPEMTDGLINYILTPWYQNFIGIEPLEYLERVKCPVLALTGEKDVQCPPELNLPGIQEAIIKGGNKDFLVKTLPDLNHLFQTSKSGLPVEYDNIAEIISPAAMELMLEWIKKSR